MSKSTNNYLEVVKNLNKDIRNIVKEDLKTVESIDFQIESLLRQRNCVLHVLDERTRAYGSFKTMLCCSPKNVMEGYVADGFKSEVVKHAVMNLRKLFFDDTDKRFQDFSCTQIIQVNYQGLSIRFLFSDSSKHEMSFCFNVCNTSFESLYRGKLLTGYVYFSVKEGMDFHTVTRSIDISEIRECVRNYISNGYKSEYVEFDHIGLDGRIDKIFSDFTNNRKYEYYFNAEENHDN